MALFFDGGGGVALQVHHGATTSPTCNIEWRTQMTNFHEKREFFNFLKLHQMSSHCYTTVHQRWFRDGVIIMESFWLCDHFPRDQTWICRDLAWSGVIQDISMTPILVNHPSIQFSLGGFTRAQELVITTVVLTCSGTVYFYVWADSIPWDKCFNTSRNFILSHM